MRTTWGGAADAARQVKSVKSGERDRFHEWIAGGTHVDPAACRNGGDFTARAPLTREPTAGAAEFKRRRGLECP